MSELTKEQIKELSIDFYKELVLTAQEEVAPFKKLLDKLNNLKVMTKEEEGARLGATLTLDFMRNTEKYLNKKLSKLIEEGK